MRMSSMWGAAIAAMMLGGTGFAGRTHAAVDYFANYPVPYIDENQGNEAGNSYCFAPNLIQGELGVPMPNVLMAAFQPKFMLINNSQSQRVAPRITPRNLLAIKKHYKNINVLAGESIRYHLDYSGSGNPVDGIYNETVSIDMSHPTAKYGATSEGRAKVLRLAKLVVLTLVNSMKRDYEAGKFRLFLTFKGLPSQNGMQGARVYEKTEMPYTPESPVVLAYEAELMAKRCAD